MLRRIIRRALRHGHKLGVGEPFFYRLVAPLVAQMGEAYPELGSRQKAVENALRDEELQFAKTLDRGLAVLEEALADLKDSVIPGELIFRLYDTYGFPVDLTNDIARERDYSLDLDGYERCMEAQRQRARAASHFEVDYTDKLEIDGETAFTGYETLEGEASVQALFREGEAVESVQPGDKAVVVLDTTPCYGESGGQVGDRGLLLGEALRFEITDCKKQGDNHLHIGQVRSGELKVGTRVNVAVDAEARAATAQNHSATHLLQAALRQRLGDQVNQQGSLVDAQRLRFDFSHGQALSEQELADIEALVNAEIWRNSPVQAEEMSMDDARARGAMALFGEKYGDTVRVLTMGDNFSVELCGGTHVRRTGDIGLMKIVSESGIAAGIRRIEALTGAAALAYYRDLENRFDQVASILKTRREGAVDRAEQLIEDNKQLQRQLEAMKVKLASSSSGDILDKAIKIGDVSVLSAVVEGADAKTLRDMADQIKSRIGSGVVLLGAVNDDKVALIAGVTKDLTGRVKAGDLMKFVAQQVGGKGGGRPDMAQGGGADCAALPAAIDSVCAWVEENLGSS